MVWKESFSVELKPIAPFNFKLTMHKPAGWWWSTPDEVFQNEVLWTAVRLEGKLLGLRLNSTGTLLKPKLTCTVYAKNPLNDEKQKRFTETLKRTIRTNEDINDFYKVVKDDKILREVVGDLYGMRTVAWPDLFPALILVTTLQMAPWKRSSQMMDLLLKNYGRNINFDGRTVRYWPPSERIAALNVEELKSKANLGYRAKNLIAAAKEICAGFPTMDELNLVSSEEAKNKLMTLPGIGEYSAELLNPRMGFPLDVWSAKIFNVLLLSKETDSPRDAIPALKKAAEERWGKWRGHVFVYVLNDLPKISTMVGFDLTKF